MKCIKVRLYRTYTFYLGQNWNPSNIAPNYVRPENEISSIELQWTKGGCTLNNCPIWSTTGVYNPGSWFYFPKNPLGEAQHKGIHGQITPGRGQQKSYKILLFIVCLHFPSSFSTLSVVELWCLGWKNIPHCSQVNWCYKEKANPGKCVSLR